MQQYESEANQAAARELRVYRSQLRHQLANSTLTDSEVEDVASEYVILQEQLGRFPAVMSLDEECYE
jgi:septation ring formation regulator EzrA